MAKQNPQREILKKVGRRMKRYWVGILASLVLALVYVVMTLTIPILVGDAIDCILEPGKVYFSEMAPILGKVAACALIAACAQWIMNIVNNHMTFHITRDLRNEAFTHIQKIPLSYLDAHSQGDLVSRVVSDVDTFADGLLMGFTQLFTGVMTILGTLLFMLRIHPGIALVVILITPLSLLVANFIATRSYSMFQLQTKTRGEQTGLIDETVGGAKVVRAFGHEKQTMEQFDAGTLCPSCDLLFFLDQSLHPVRKLCCLCRCGSQRCTHCGEWRDHGGKSHLLLKLRQSVYQTLQ